MPSPFPMDNKYLQQCQHLVHMTTINKHQSCEAPDSQERLEGRMAPSIAKPARTLINIDPSYQPSKMRHINDFFKHITQKYRQVTLVEPRNMCIITCFTHLNYFKSNVFPFTITIGPNHQGLTFPHFSL